VVQSLVAQDLVTVVVVVVILAPQVVAVVDSLVVVELENKWVAVAVVDMLVLTLLL
jgi:hypothetical protein